MHGALGSTRRMHGLDDVIRRSEQSKFRPSSPTALAKAVLQHLVRYINDKETALLKLVRKFEGHREKPVAKLCRDYEDDHREFINAATAQKEALLQTESARLKVILPSLRVYRMWSLEAESMTGEWQGGRTGSSTRS